MRFRVLRHHAKGGLGDVFLARDEELNRDVARKEIQMLARCCGKSDVHNLEPEDLRSLTLEAEAITGVPLVGRIGER